MPKQYNFTTTANNMTEIKNLVTLYVKSLHKCVQGIKMIARSASIDTTVV